MGNDAYIVGLSGGLDSTFLVYKLLEEGKNVFAFHLSLKHKAENRWEGELSATMLIEKWFKSRYNTFNMRYATFEFSSFGLGWDADSILLASQKMCYKMTRDRCGVFDRIFVARGVVTDDLSDFIIRRESYKGIGTTNLLWGSLIDSMRYKVKSEFIDKIDRKIKNILLDENISKKDIIDMIPEDLLDMVWVCRRQQKDGKQCYGVKCKSCKKHLEAINASNKYIHRDNKFRTSFNIIKNKGELL